MPLETQGKQPRENSSETRTADRTRQVYGEPPDWKIVTKSRDGVSGLGKELCLGLTNEGLRGGAPEAFKEGTDTAKIADAFHWSKEQRENYTLYSKKHSYRQLVGMSREDKQQIPGYKEYCLRDNVTRYKNNHGCLIEEAIRVYQEKPDSPSSSRRRQPEQGQSSRGEQGASNEPEVPWSLRGLNEKGQGLP